MSSSVHKGRFIQIPRNPHEKLAQQKDVEQPAAKECRQNQRSQGVGKMEGSPADKLGDHDNGEREHQSREHNPEYLVAPRPVDSGEPVSTQGAGEQNPDNIRYRHNPAVHKESSEWLGSQGIDKIVEDQVLGNERRLQFKKLIGPHKRRPQHPINRKQREECSTQQNEIDQQHRYFSSDFHDRFPSPS